MSKPRYNAAAGALKGQFDVVVTRLTADVALNLPVAIFGTAALQAGYQSLLSLPAGATLAITAGLDNATNYGYVDFAYTVGGNTDIVRVTSTTLQYPELVAALMTDLLSYQSVKMTLSGNSDTSQFNQSITLATNNVLGSKSRDSITPASYISATQFQSNQVNLPIAGTLDKESAWTFDVVQDAAIEINFSFFFDNYTPYNAERVLG